MKTSKVLYKNPILCSSHTVHFMWNLWKGYVMPYELLLKNESWNNLHSSFIYLTFLRKT